MNWDKYKVPSNKTLNLKNIETNNPIKKSDKKKFKKELHNDIKDIAQLQNKLFAEDRQSLLIILQGMDSAGKDGTIKRLMNGVNPQGVIINSFKHPSNLELEHNYLWRHARKLPERGQIVVFNRSHYENVLISKVHPELVLAECLPDIDSINKIDKTFWEKRYSQINNFEKNTIENGTLILKFFLYISKEEQAKRFLDRIENKEKHWKFSSSDIIERDYWIDYQKAYEQALEKTSTKIAPWYIVPADNKLYAHWLIGKIILEKMKSMSLTFPTVSKKEKELLLEAKEKLEKENKH